MSRRMLLIVAGVVVFVTVVAAVAAVLLRPAPAPEEPAAEAPTPTASLAPAGGLPQVNANVPTASAPAAPAETFTRASDQEILEQRLVSSAGQFAERFGTYSNQADFQNLVDLYPLMTASMREATERTIAQARSAGGGGDGYVGVTTRAVSTTLASLDATGGRATVTVAAQRSTQSGDDQPTVDYRTLTLAFRRSGDLWLVDSATWSAQ